MQEKYVFLNFMRHWTLKNIGMTKFQKSSCKDESISPEKLFDEINGS